jgi:hypothetical protein
MVLVHLYYVNLQFGPAGPWLGEYSRFAAGGFVFVAGLAIGAIFLPKSQEPNRRMSIYRRLWERSLRVLGWQYLVAIAWVALDVYNGSHDPVNSVWQLLYSVFTLREGGDLLPLYVILIALAPLLMECFRFRGGRWALAAVSIGVFIFGRFHPYALAVDPQGKFPPLLWQIVFISGFFCGSLLKSYDRLAFNRKLAICSGAWVSFGLLFWCEYWKTFNLWPCPLSLVFTKTPLTTGELLRYLTMVVGLLTATDLLWRHIAFSLATSFATTLGRSTLVVYVAHTFLIEFCRIKGADWAWMGQWQLMSIPITLAMLWLLAVALQWPKRTASALDWQWASPQRVR